MLSINISAVSLNTTPLDFSGNTNLIIEALKSDEVLSADMVLFPELCISGYGCEDAFYKESVWQRSWASLTKILPFSKNKTVIVGLPIFHGSSLYNCSAVISNSEIIGLVPKLNLANTGIHYEKRWFQSTHEFISDTYYPISTPNGNSIKPIPFGHFIFEKLGVRFAIEICEDSWVTKRASHQYAEQGLDILFSPGASHFSMGKREVRFRIFQETSRTNQIVTVFTNLCGNESGRAIYEGGAFFCNRGEVTKEGQRLFFSPYSIISQNVSISEIRSLRAKEKRSLPSSHSLTQIPVIRIPEEIPGLKILDMRVKNGKQNLSSIPAPQSLYEDFTKAVSLGLYDYLIKSKTKGYTLSLSGGADSAACALLVDSMKRFVKQEFGENSFESLGIKENKILVTLYQKTENNSNITEEIATLLTQELNTEHHNISIDSSVSLAVSLIESTQNRKLNWETDDLALQNIQARVRSPLIWLLANLNSHLLLSTGNRSEASVGYTTMDGDASGSICPISGVSKEFLLAWIDDIQAGKNKYISHKESLRLLRETKPTAELRPLSEKQEDEKDLMPYPLLQKIEFYFVAIGIDKEECLLRLHIDFPDLEESYLEFQVNKFIRLFGASQWKRERLPPSFHLDTYGLDPKTSYRYPILSGGF
ncbi:MAG: NAD(+) synthase [Leptospira sp.]|nr:NAD(+) synthase [Leptospira sp.]